MISDYYLNFYKYSSSCYWFYCFVLTSTEDDGDGENCYNYSANVKPLFYKFSSLFTVPPTLFCLPILTKL